MSDYINSVPPFSQPPQARVELQRQDRPPLQNQQGWQETTQTVPAGTDKSTSTVPDDAFDRPPVSEPVSRVVPSNVAAIDIDVDMEETLCTDVDLIVDGEDVTDQIRALLVGKFDSNGDPLG